MPSDFLIEKMRPADLDRILEIEYACFRKDAYDRKLFAEYARTCGNYFLVARRRTLSAGAGQERAGPLPAQSGHEICGYILTCPSRGGAELVSVAVDPAVRRAGAATALMNSTLRRLVARGLSRLTLTVRVTNRKAIRFYGKHGFKKVRLAARYYEDGQDGWVMVKTLRRVL